MNNKSIAKSTKDEIEAYLKNLSQNELLFIARLDYGQDANKHLESLKLIISRGGLIDNKSEYWHPYEVIELGAFSLQEGHERECAACIMMVILNKISNNEPIEAIDEYISDRLEAISILPEFQKKLIQNLIWV